MKANPRYSEFHSVLTAHAYDWLEPWEGDCWRFQDIEFPTANEILSGAGAQRFGGRLNFRGTFPVVYGSSTEDTALKESAARATRYGLVVRKPRILVAIELKLQRVLDLRRANVRRLLGIALKELQHEDWEKLQDHGTEALSQALGRAASVTGAEAVMIPSFAQRGGVNVAWFPANKLKGSACSIHEGSKLPKAGSSRP
jgi:RES domain-containing protein